MRDDLSDLLYSRTTVGGQVSRRVHACLGSLPALPHALTVAVSDRKKSRNAFKSFVVQMRNP